MTQCVLCKSSQLRRVHQITFGVWEDAKSTEHTNCEQGVDKHKLLVRDTQNYDLVECVQCHHVQVAAKYHQALFEKLYFHSDQEEVMWHEALRGNYQAYQDMVAFTQEYLPASANIADFGCGTGSLLSAFQQHYQQGLTLFSEQPSVLSSAKSGIQNTKLYGIDFNPRCNLDFVEYKRADLNDYSQFRSCKIEQGYDLVCASHTLEHVTDPVMFLRGMSETLNEQGKLFIEVPDFSNTLHPQLAAQSNLVNLQHIQYFTSKTLAYCAEQAGLEVIKYKQVLTGYIPRLLVILAKPDASVIDVNREVHQQLMTVSTNSAIVAIDSFCSIADSKRQKVVEYCEHAVSAKQTIGLWGIGADFYLMLRDIPAFSELLISPYVALFDYEHAGKYIQSKQIVSSQAISRFVGEVILLPSLAETRVKMHALSMDWPVVVKDIYQQDILAVDGLVEQACQICQNTDWQHIETLSSGIWRTENNHLVRDELEFPIGECRACKHTQIYRPYSAAIFEKLYFSSDLQPEMWHTPKGQASPYYEMLALFLDELNGAENIADFGCGEGLLMREIKQAKPDANVVGFDFNIQGDDPDITRVSCDLNNQTQMHKAYDGLKFDVITSSHVLEHVINPLMFLQALKSRLHDNGCLFIEVPDSSACHQSLQLHSTNLVHGQHIHYYTQDSLEHIAKRAGLKIIKQRQFVSGNIPRLQMLFSPIDNQESMSFKFVPPIHESASTTVTARFTQYYEQLRLISDCIQKQLAESNIIGLWGVGGDFHQLTKFDPSIVKAVSTQKIILFDYALKELHYANQVIKNSTEISTADFPVLVTPMYMPTRAKMLEIAESWPVFVIDPYRSKNSKTL